MKHHLNCIILHDGRMYHLFERMKGVPFDAYNPEKSIFSSENLSEIFENRRRISSENPQKSSVPRFEIEEKPYEVVFNE